MTADELRTARRVLSERHEELASESRSMGSPMVQRRYRTPTQERARGRRYRDLFKRMDALQVALDDLTKREIEEIRALEEEAR